MRIDDLTWHPYDGELPPNFGDEGKRKLEWAHVRIYRGDLERLDRVITFVEAMAELFSEDFYDDLWNMRNGMVEFQPGDKHYDAELQAASQVAEE